MIVQTVNKSAFHNAFTQMNREHNFTYEALDMLFEYLDNLSDDLGKPIELDVIAICCEYVEMSLDEVLTSYDVDMTKDEAGESIDDAMKHVEQWLNDHTALVGVTSDNTFVFQQF